MHFVAETRSDLVTITPSDPVSMVKVWKLSGCRHPRWLGPGSRWEQWPVTSTAKLLLAITTCGPVLVDKQRGAQRFTARRIVHPRGQFHVIGKEVPL